MNSFHNSKEHKIMDFSNPFAFDSGEQQFPITSPNWPMTSSDPLGSVVTSSSRRSRYQSHPGAVREGEAEEEEEEEEGTRVRKLSQRQLSQVLGIE